MRRRIGEMMAGCMIAVVIGGAMLLWVVRWIERLTGDDERCSPR